MELFGSSLLFSPILCPPDPAPRGEALCDWAPKLIERKWKKYDKNERKKEKNEKEEWEAFWDWAPKLDAVEWEGEEEDKEEEMSEKQKKSKWEKIRRRRNEWETEEE